MNDAVRKHMVRYPHCRTSTVQYLARRHETTERLRQELEAQKRVNEFRDEIGFISWVRRMLGRK